LFSERKLVLKNFKISFSVLDFGQRGRGECPKSKTPYYNITTFIQKNKVKFG